MVTNLAVRQSAPERFEKVSVTRSTEWLFRSMCFFLMTQVFLIPIAPLGHWSFWPRLSDVAFLLMLGTWLQVPRSIARQNPPALSFSRSIWLILLVVFISFMSGTVILSAYDGMDVASLRSLGFGLYGLVRLAQFALLAQMVTSVPITPQRHRIIGRIMAWSVVLASIGCIATFSSIVTPGQLSAWLPTGEIAGGWWGYERRVGQGLGTIGYNHGYVAAQILLLLAMALGFMNPRRKWLGLGLIAVASLGVFVSGSRSGLLSFSVFAGAWILGRPLVEKIATLVISTTGVVAIGIVYALSPRDHAIAQILERQITAFLFLDADNLSGRDEIWISTWQVFNESRIVEWIFGRGFGSTMEDGAAHNLVLTYLVEFGAVGFALMIVMFVALLWQLWRRDQLGRPLFWLTIALLIGSFSQETFYPATWNGHFLGFYFVAVILVFSSRADYRAHHESRPWKSASRHGYRASRFATKRRAISLR